MLMEEIYAFAAAHSVPAFSEGVHGHTWTVRVFLDAELGEGGFAFDHAEIDDVALGVIGRLDHKMLNEIEGLERGLSEDVLAWIVERLRPSVASTLGARLTRVELGELSTRAGRLITHTKIWDEETAP